MTSSAPRLSNAIYSRVLAVDVGNSNISVGLFNGSEIERVWRCHTQAHVTSDELALTLRGLLGAAAEEVTGIAALSTVPALLPVLRTMAAKYWPNAPSVVVAPGVKTGIPLLVDNPKEVGADRVVNALASQSIVNGAGIVVDLGTSTSIDVISPRGEFLGGAIAPGVEISISALALNAAALRMVELAAPRSVLGKNTVAAIQSGVVLGGAAMVDGMVERLREAVPEIAEAPVIATGGLSAVVAEHSRSVTLVEPNLTLIGLYSVFCRNF